MYKLLKTEYLCRNIQDNGMNAIKLIMIIILCLPSVCLKAKAPAFRVDQPDIKPHRIIRTCCSFGTEMQLVALPGIKLTEITSLDKIGSHQYLGHPKEGNGIIYSRRGGFIDMAHLRDQCDWTAYLYTQLLKNKSNGGLNVVLGYEGGEKSLNVNITSSLDNADLIKLAGKIAYDLSVWHEIATWFGASTIPFVPERYSSFSVEDPYSNLLGVTIGMQALESELPYESAVTMIIGQTLKDLEAVQNEAETYMAMEAVRDVWWTRDKKLPSSKVLIQRHLDVYSCLQPWLVPGWIGRNQFAQELKIPESTTDGLVLNTLYALEFKLNYKFPFRKMFPERKDRNINQNDFDRLLAQVAKEIIKKENRVR